MTTPVPMLPHVPRGELLCADRLAPQRPHASVRFTDDRWRPATIVAWCRYRGRWAVLLRWADGREDWWAHDSQHMLCSLERLGRPPGTHQF